MARHQREVTSLEGAGAGRKAAEQGLGVGRALASEEAHPIQASGASFAQWTRQLLCQLPRGGSFEVAGSCQVLCKGEVRVIRPWSPWGTDTVVSQ